MEFVDGVLREKPGVIRFEVRLEQCPLCQAAPALLAAAHAAWHLCQSLLASATDHNRFEGPTTTLVSEVRDSLWLALTEATKGRH